ncbi:DegV family protein [Aquibacillus sediminis]|uniref:DegV family protein n=1 Tax=Aquibacillus sediminis TaxID=2574734 RepID=UPI0011092A66|nr:DegV family protein [Aquibacillus sediminis]
MTKKKLAFVTDSTAFLTKEICHHPDVFVVPIAVIAQDISYEDGVDLSSEQLYKIIRNDKQVPKTSQPPHGQFIQLYEKLQKEYEEVIAVHVSSALSGTLASSIYAKDQLGFDVEVVDSRSVSYGLTILLEYGIKMSKRGEGMKEIANGLQQLTKQINHFVLIGNLEQLYKGGRMSGARFLIGNFLRIKPILTINKQGELVLYERIRSENKAMKRMIDVLKQSSSPHNIKQSSSPHNIKQIGIMHGNAEAKAIQLKQQVLQEIPYLDVVIGEISSSIAVHAGEDTIAVVWQTE